MKIRISYEPAFVLHFDIENRPLSYLGKDFTTAEITGIAWGWADQEDVYCRLLTREPGSMVEMLEAFTEAYDAADVVCGHYIRGHDLKLVNGALIENQLLPLSTKLVQDTYMDRVKSSGISFAQKNLAKVYALDEDKVDMSDFDWRVANRLEESGMVKTYRRVVGDVIQNRALRFAMLKAGVLKEPRQWKP